MSKSTTAKAVTPASLKKAVIGSMVGTSLEWYDFFLYGSAAALVFNHVFFPSFNPVIGTLLALATFSIGFIARPIGGVIAGHFGDRFGRKNVLLATLLVMGGTTVAIGLIPSYDTIGIAAPIILILLRVLQGIALGGEWAGGALMIAERAPDTKRGFLTSFVQVGVPIGTLLSAAVLFILSALLSEDQFLNWGWRLPFVLSILVVILGVFIRRQVSESPAFIALSEVESSKAEHETKRMPIVEVLKEQPFDVLRVIGIRVGGDIVYYTCATFMLTYVAQHLGLPRSVGLLASVIGAGFQIIACPSFARLSDRFGRRPVTIFGAVGCMVWVFAFFPLMDTRSTTLIVIAVASGLIFQAAMYGVQAAWICELFDTKHRYSGASIGYQLSGVVGGSLAPIIALSLLSAFDSTMPVQIYIVIGCVIVVLTALKTRETRGINIMPQAEQPSNNSIISST